MKVFVPMALRAINPFLWHWACQQQTQALADGITRSVIPGWVGESAHVGQRQGVFREDVQAAGSYSLAACVGGNMNHTPSKKPIPARVLTNKRVELHAVVSGDIYPQSDTHVRSDLRGTKQ